MKLLFDVHVAKVAVGALRKIAPQIQAEHIAHWRDGVFPRAGMKTVSSSRTTWRLFRICCAAGVRKNVRIRACFLAMRIPSGQTAPPRWRPPWQRSPKKSATRTRQTSFDFFVYHADNTNKGRSFFKSRDSFAGVLGHPALESLPLRIVRQFLNLLNRNQDETFPRTETDHDPSIFVRRQAWKCNSFLHLIIIAVHLGGDNCSILLSLIVIK